MEKWLQSQKSWQAHHWRLSDWFTDKGKRQVFIGLLGKRRIWLLFQFCSARWLHRSCCHVKDYLSHFPRHWDKILKAYSIQEDLFWLMFQSTFSEAQGRISWQTSTVEESYSHSRRQKTEEAKWRARKKDLSKTHPHWPTSFNQTSNPLSKVLRFLHPYWETKASKVEWAKGQYPKAMPLLNSSNSSCYEYYL